MPVGGKEPPSAASPPLVPYGTTFPPQKRWDNKAQVNICFKKLLYIKHGLFCPRLRGKSREAGKGERISLARRAVVWFH